MDATELNAALRRNRLCAHCEHQHVPHNAHPCSPCYGNDAKPNWEPKVIKVTPRDQMEQLNRYIQNAQDAEPPTNPKQAFGDKKPPLHLIHAIAQLHESAALHSGRRKYGENNYIESPVEAMTYLGAILRHTQQYISGERVDRKELVHHLGAVKACCTILLTAEATGMLIDNRPKVGGATRYRTERHDYDEATTKAFEEVTSIIEHLNELYPQ